MEYSPLIIVKCLPAQLSSRCSEEIVRKLLSESLSQQQDTSKDQFDSLLACLFRIVVAPYPLTLSVAEAFVNAAEEVYIDNSVADLNETYHVENVEEWVNSHDLQRKVRTYYGENSLKYCFNMPKGRTVLAVVTTVFVTQEKKRKKQPVCELTLSSIDLSASADVTWMSPDSGDRDRADYNDDVVAARIHVAVVRKARAALQTQLKKRQAQPPAFPEVASMLSPLPDLRMESSETLEQNLRDVSTSTQKLSTALQALKSCLASRRQ